MKRHSRKVLLLAGLLVGVSAWLSKSHWSADKEVEMARLATLLAIEPGMTVAEIGAGDGTMTLEAARLVGAGGRVLSTEMEPDKRNAIEAAARQAGLANIEVLPAAEDSSSLGPASCDAIFSRRVYHHFTQPEAIGRDLWAALKPGGRLGIIDFEKRWFLPKPEGVPASRAGHGVSPDLVVAELEHAGFQLERRIDDWPGDAYCLIFKKPAQTEAPGPR